jgi:uncharacterized membrane protein YtjA (UPF0391 family)
MMFEIAYEALVVGLIASVLGFTPIAGAPFSIAKDVARVALALSLVLLALAWGLGTGTF